MGRIPICAFPGDKLTDRMRILDQDGITAVGEYIRPGDVYINMHRPSNIRDPILSATVPDNFYRPTPQSWKGPSGESCVVDKVLLTGVVTELINVSI